MNDPQRVQVSPLKAEDLVYVPQPGEAPHVKAGARIRLRQSLVAVEDGAPGAHRITVRQTLEIEGEAKPAMIADTIRMSFT